MTIYSFSIDNFRRIPIEVDTVMDLWHKELLEYLIPERYLLNIYFTMITAPTQKPGSSQLLRHDIRLRVIGQIDLLPTNVRIASELAMKLSRNNKRQA